MLGTNITHYHLIEKLGEGGMGVVFKAIDTKLNRPVALKFLSSELTQDKESKDRFIQEAQAASILQHINICTIHEIDETKDGQLFIAMDYYEGETLEQKLKRGPFKIDEAINIITQIAHGLKKTHEKGIIHRDIKPANIFITDEGVVKILDFGLAKLTMKADLTSPGLTIGTPLYMSPEQLQGLQVDHRADIWALGILLYEMIIGEPPFKGEYHQELIYRILAEDPLHSHKSALPEPVYQSIKRAIAKAPDDRYENVQEFISNLQLQKSETEQIIFGTSLISSLKKTFARHRIPVLTLFVFIILLGSYFSFFSSRGKYNVSTYVVMADFENYTSEPLLEHSLTAAFRVALRQSAQINLLSNSRIRNTLERMKLPQDRKITEKLAIDIARREGVSIVVSGNISKIGNKFLLTGHIIESKSAEIIKIHREEFSHIENVLKQLEELSNMIRRDLGDPLQNIADSDLSLEKVTTSSLQALELYSRGIQLEAKGDYAGAIELMEQAVSIDSLFVMAISDLSYSYIKIGDHNKASYYHQKILPLIDRVTEREKYPILIFYYGPSFELNYEKAFQYAKEWTIRYPNDPEGFAFLGHLAMFSGNYDIALQANMKSLAIDSTTFAGTLFSNTGFAYALKGDIQKALHFFAKSKKIRPAYFTLDLYISKVLWMNGEPDSAKHLLFSILPKIKNIQKVQAYCQLASISFSQGKLNEALEQCTKAILLTHQKELASEYAYLQYLTGRIRIEKNNKTAYLSKMKEAAQSGKSPFMELPFIGYNYAQNGLINQAEEILKRIETIETQEPHFLNRRENYIHLIQGEILIQSKKFHQAQQHFNRIKRLHAGDPIYLIAQKRHADCKKLLADSTYYHDYLNFLDLKGELFMSFLSSVRTAGFWISDLWIDTLADISKYYALTTGDKQRAQEYLTPVIDIYKNADKDYLKAVQTKQFYNQLTNYK